MVLTLAALHCSSHTSTLSQALSFSTFIACIFFLIASILLLVLEMRWWVGASFRSTDSGEETLQILLCHCNSRFACRPPCTSSLNSPSFAQLSSQIISPGPWSDPTQHLRCNPEHDFQHDSDYPSTHLFYSSYYIVLPLLRFLPSFSSCYLLKFLFWFPVFLGVSHSLIISREVLILTLSIFNTLNVCISWYSLCSLEGVYRAILP